MIPAILPTVSEPRRARKRMRSENSQKGCLRGSSIRRTSFLSGGTQLGYLALILHGRSMKSFSSDPPSTVMISMPAMIVPFVRLSSKCYNFTTYQGLDANFEGGKLWSCNFYKILYKIKDIEVKH